MSIFGPADELSEGLKPQVASAESKAPILTSSEADFTSAQEFQDPDEETVRQRFSGRPSKWRKLTRFDRQIVRGQDAIDDDNLSIHLYDAHVLKSGVRRPAASLSNLKSWQSKARWRFRQDWVPGKLWTAWPLDESIVETLNTKKGPLATSQYRPNGNLEQQISAIITREAYKNFNIGMQNGSADHPNSDHEDPETEPELATKGHLEGQPSLDDISEVLQEPLPMADDDKAWKLTRPRVRRTINSLNSLLKAIHNANQNRYGHTSEIGARISRSESGVSSSRQSLSRKRSLSQTGRQPVRSGSRNSVEPKPETRKTKPRRRNGLRDWSEILGLALQSGWEADVVHIAAARCSKLFSENMRFESLEESRQQIPSSSISNNETSPKGSDRICPVPDCERHYSSRPKLRRHMHDQHKLNIVWPDRKGDTVFTFEPGQRRQDATRYFVKRQTNVSHCLLSDGTHLDGFLQPILAGKGWVGRADKS